MAFVMKRPNCNTLCRKVKGDDGRWRNEVVCALGPHPDAETALLHFRGEEQALIEEISATDAEVANPRWGYKRQSQLAGLQYRERLGEVRDRIQRLTAYLASEAVAT